MAVASLPMYDLPELHTLTDAWWANLARALRIEGYDTNRIPAALTRNPIQGLEWRDPELLLSQCCGYDLTHDAAPFLQLIGTPIYAVEDCDGPYYRSLIIVRASHPGDTLADLRGEVCAINASGSHSGYNVLRFMLAPLAQGQAFFRTVKTSGSHTASLQMVQTQVADCAAIDCVSFALLQRYRPAVTAGLRVLERSPLAPGLPYVTSLERSEQELAHIINAVHNVFVDHSCAYLRDALLLSDLEHVPLSRYQSLLTMEQQAIAMDYPHIA